MTDAQLADRVGRLRRLVMTCARMPHLAQPLDMPRTEPFEPADPVDVTITGTLTVVVDQAAAEQSQDEFRELLGALAEKMSLRQGPSYIYVGAMLGSQTGAFLLFAVGQVLGFWRIINPETFGFEGEEAARLAGNGLVMIDGWSSGEQP